MRAHPRHKVEPSIVDLALLVVSFYLMFSPVWAPALVPRMYDNARILEVAVLLVLTISVVVPGIASACVMFWNTLPRGTRRLILIFLGGGVVSALASAHPQIGTLQIALVAELVLLFLLIGAAATRIERQGTVILAAAVVTGAALVLLKFWISFVQEYVAGRSFSWVSPFLDFANVRFFGQYQAYALLLLTLPIRTMDLPNSWRAMIYLVAANFWALQWMVGARAVWAGFFAAIVVVAVFMRKGRVQWMTEQGAVVVAGGVIYFCFSALVLSTPNATPIPAINSILARGEESSSERITLAKAAIGMVADSPLTGVGPGQFGLHYSKTNAAHPHDTPLQLLAEYGLVAGTAGVALGALLVVFAVRQLRSKTMLAPDLTIASLVAGLIMGLVDSLFSGNLIMPHSQVLFCVMAGWIVGGADRTVVVPEIPVSRQRLQRVTLVGLGFLAALTAAILTLEYVEVIRDMPYPPALRIPSFWQYGRFTQW